MQKKKNIFIKKEINTLFRMAVWIRYRHGLLHSSGDSQSLSSIHHFRVKVTVMLVMKRFFQLRDTDTPWWKKPHTVHITWRTGGRFQERPITLWKRLWQLSENKPYTNLEQPFCLAFPVAYGPPSATMIRPQNRGDDTLSPWCLRTPTYTTQPHHWEHRLIWNNTKTSPKSDYQAVHEHGCHSILSVVERWSGSLIASCVFSDCLCML